MSVRYASPLRYPGGKGAFHRVVGDAIAKNKLEGCRYFEPFAGGAGAALRLLYDERVESIHLNDADHRIYCFWKAVTRENSRFVEKVLSVKVTLQEWRKHKEICDNPRKFKVFEVGFATFFLNRCNRSGVICGAGPIGGHSQSTPHKIDARFNAEELATRIKRIATFSSRITIKRMEAMRFLKAELPKGKERGNVFVYLDPPYIGQGGRLYLNLYGAKDHAALANYIQRQRSLPWLLSYDNHAIVRGLYSRSKSRVVGMCYSLNARALADELLIWPRYLKM